MGEKEVNVGHIVHYVVSSLDPKELRANGAEILPAIVVKVWAEDTVNLQVFSDSFSAPMWRTSITHGFGPTQWHWPWETEEDEDE